ncbi:hypothetical protein JOC85_001171 [Bacillus mesophilus]|uniref:Uncharacterized protein n=1 Tax=Bacillus mesophilus TaxID=1808955 RepID=A0A6M0Q4E4_9BACI|nr:hypothetical protein [Bacillus mesophilus]MBM7660404.1 hypothetical protein [Bacillus mesophilus]NEY71112.1 hypothetical protein [Bacillus mesophilus]
MKISTSYPYPVLYMNNDDYVNSSFHAQIGITESFGEVKINVNFNLVNEGIQRLVENNEAVFLVHVECPQTSYRNAFKSDRNELEVGIPTEKLRGKLLIHTFIIANDRIVNYTNESLNEWFKDSPITYEKGNILAIGDAIETTLFEDNKELLNLPSIVKVTKSLKNDFMEVDIHSNVITISLPEYEYNQYALHSKSRFKSTIISSVIVPSLVYVFSKIKDSREDLEEYKWYQVLENTFEANNYRLEDVGTDSLSSLKAAQLVLRKPIKTSFLEIEQLSKTED